MVTFFLHGLVLLLFLGHSLLDSNTTQVQSLLVFLLFLCVPAVFTVPVRQQTLSPILAG